MVKVHRKRIEEDTAFIDMAKSFYSNGDENEIIYLLLCIFLHPFHAIIYYFTEKKKAFYPLVNFYMPF